MGVCTIESKAKLVDADRAPIVVGCCTTGESAVDIADPAKAGPEVKLAPRLNGVLTDESSGTEKVEADDLSTKFAENVGSDDNDDSFWLP